MKPVCGPRSVVVAACGYALLMTAVTWPLALTPAHAIVADHGDGFFDMLMFHYARDGRLFAPRVDSLFFPWGVAMGSEQGYWLVPCMSVPLQWLAPLPLVFNLLGALFFVSSGAAVFVVARLTGLREAPSFVAGALVVLSPSYLNEMSAGILENMALVWPALYLVCGLRLRERASNGLALAAGACLTLSFLTSWYLGLFAAVFTVLLPLRRIWPGLVLAGALLLVPVMRLAGDGQVAAGHAYDPSVARALASGVDVPDLGAQGATMQVMGDSADWSLLLTRARSGRHMQFLPGVLLLGLAALGIWSAPRRTARLALLAAALLGLALGPWLVWRGHGLCPLPTEWLYVHLPLVARLRPVRWLLPATLILALLAARALPRLRRPGAEAALAAAVVALQAVEVLWIQVPVKRLSLASARVPAFYQRLASTSGAVIELPLVPYMLVEGRHLYYQAVHGRPLLNYNFVTRASEERLFELGRRNTLVSMLLQQAGEVKRDDVDEVRRLGYGTLVLHLCAAQPGAESRPSVGFTPLAFETLSRIYGAPQAQGDDIVTFDLGAPRSDVWSPDGRLQPARETMELVRHPAPLPLTVRPGGDGWTDVYAWVEGPHTCLSVTRGGQTFDAEPAAAAEEDDSKAWRWQHVTLPAGGGPITLQAKGGTSPARAMFVAASRPLP